MYVCRQCEATDHVNCRENKPKIKYCITIFTACLACLTALYMNYTPTTKSRYHEALKNVENQNVETILTYLGHPYQGFAVFNNTMYYMSEKKTIERVSTYGLTMLGFRIPDHINAISFTVTDQGDILLAADEGIFVLNHNDPSEDKITKRRMQSFCRFCCISTAGYTAVAIEMCDGKNHLVVLENDENYRKWRTNLNKGTTYKPGTIRSLFLHKGIVYIPVIDTEVNNRHNGHGLLIYDIKNGEWLPMSALNPSYFDRIVDYCVSYFYPKYYSLENVRICDIDSVGSVLVCEPEANRLVLISPSGFVQQEYKIPGVVYPETCSISESHIFILYRKVNSQNVTNYLAKIPRN